MMLARMYMLCLASCAALVTACGQAPADAPDGSEGSPDVTSPDGGAVDDGEGAVERPAGLPVCAPPLSVAPALAHVLPHGLTFLVPTGGTGIYELLLTDASVGTLNPRTGAFLAGATAGVSSRVLITDEGCAGVADAA